MLLAVLVEEELGVGQARPHDALVALDRPALGSAGRDVADDEEAVGQPAGGVEQREVLLVRLHRQDQALRRHRQELGVEAAGQHVRPLDQRGHFVEQRRRRRSAPALRRRRRRPAGARSRRAARRSWRSPRPGRAAARVAVGVAQHDRRDRRLEAVAARRRGRRRGRARAPARRRRRAARPGRAPGARSRRWSSRRRAGSCISLGIGRPASASSSAGCSPSASVAPALASAQEQRFGLAVAARARAAGTDTGVASAPSAAELLQQRRRRLAVGAEADRRPASAWLRPARSARLPRHRAMCAREAARRRERASTAERRPRPGLRLSRPSAEPAAKASPSFFSALGGSSSTNSSTSRSGRGRAHAAGLCLSICGLHFVGPGLRRHREAEPGAAVEVALRHAARQVADAADVGGALGHADGAARVEQVEAVAAFSTCS